MSRIVLTVTVEVGDEMSGRERFTALSRMLGPVVSAVEARAKFGTPLDTLIEPGHGIDITEFGPLAPDDPRRIDAERSARETTRFGDVPLGTVFHTLGTPETLLVKVSAVMAVLEGSPVSKDRRSRIRIKLSEWIRVPEAFNR